MATTGLPPLEAMGTAWKPSTLNSVEHVTARIRNGIEILASLAGMPQVAAVHIHSNPASYICGLRPKYDVVMTQGLNEADEKGMTTVCVDTLAQFLVLQDGCHAKDTYDNRALFARYLVNTLLLMDHEIQAARLRPGIDALVRAFRHEDKAFKPNEETQRIGADMAATIKRIQDEQEAQIQARINARSSGQPVASGDQKWERADKTIPTAHWKVEQRRAEIERDMRRDLADTDLDFEAPVILPDNDLLPVENDGETNLVEAGETVDEALDVIEALREEEPEGEPAVSSPQGDASFLKNTREGGICAWRRCAEHRRLRTKSHCVRQERPVASAKGSSLCTTCRKTPLVSQERGFGSTMVTLCSSPDWFEATSPRTFRRLCTTSGYGRTSRSALLPLTKPEGAVGEFAK